MPLIPPQLDDTALARPPLAVVVAQVRYEQNLSVSDGSTVLGIHERLGGRAGRYGVIEPHQVVATQLEFSTAGVTSVGPQGVPSRGYRLKSPDGHWTITIMPDFAGLETTAYTSWSGDFNNRLDELLEALSKHVEPRSEERLGLRYVNKLTDSTREEPGDWVGAISSDLLGPINVRDWAEATVGHQQQLELNLEDDTRVTVRSGFIRRSSHALDGYLLDFDVYRATPRAFDPGEILAAATRFNRIALGLFQRSLTEDCLSYLREG